MELSRNCVSCTVYSSNCEISYHAIYLFIHDMTSFVLVYSNNKNKNTSANKNQLRKYTTNIENGPNHDAFFFTMVVFCNMNQEYKRYVCHQNHNGKYFEGITQCSLKASYLWWKFCWVYLKKKNKKKTAAVKFDTCNARYWICQLHPAPRPDTHCPQWHHSLGEPINWFHRKQSPSISQTKCTWQTNYVKILSHPK